MSASETPRRVVIVAGPGQRRDVRRWRRRLRGDSVTLLAPEGVADVADLARALRGLPAPELVVVLRPAAELQPADHRALAKELLPAMAAGSEYVLDRRVADDHEHPLDAWLKDRRANRPTGVPARESGHLGHVIGRVTGGPDTVTARVRRVHWLKVRDRDIAELLPRREPGAAVEVLDRREACSVTVAGAVDTQGLAADTFPAEFHVPELEARRYRGPEAVTMATRAVSYVGHTLLPETFRWHLDRRLNNAELLPGPSPDWGRLRPRDVAKRHLAGEYFHFDNRHGYHFGHLVTETVSKLWAWDEAKRENPELKALLVHWKHRSAPPGLPARFCAAYGIDPGDVVVADAPVTVDSLVGATPMWHQTAPRYVHPELRDVWERLARGFTGGDPDRAPESGAAELLFVSRGGGAKNRACRNQDEVEAYFAGHGFTVVYPEEHPLADQVRMFRHARVVAGFGGSGLFNIMYARSLERLIVLNHESYHARNEHMMSALLGNDQHYFWSAADLAHPEGRRSDVAFKSGWEFDFDRNRPALDRLLKER